MTLAELLCRDRNGEEMPETKPSTKRLVRKDYHRRGLASLTDGEVYADFHRNSVSLAKRPCRLTEGGQRLESTIYRRAFLTV